MKKLWIKAALIRAIRTMAQTAAALIGTATVMQDVNWQMIGSAALVSGILSILTALAGLPEVDPEEAEDAYQNDVTPDTDEDDLMEDKLEEEADSDEA